MGVRHAAGPSNETDNRTDLRVRDEAAVREFHSAGHADVAAVVRLTAASADAALEAITRRSPRHLHTVVFKNVEISVRRCDECWPSVTRCGRNRPPILR